jgi:hypothetical protein
MFGAIGHQTLAQKIDAAREACAAVAC